MVEISTERKHEIYNDTVHFCENILDILKQYKGSNDDPEGRMIYQCQWLIQEVKKNELPIPFYDHIVNLRHTYIESDLLDEFNDKDIYRYIGYILSLSNGNLLVKPEHYHLVINEIDRLQEILGNASRELSPDEKQMLTELNVIKERLSDEFTHVPFNGDVNTTFKHFWQVYEYDESTIDDIPEAHEHLEKMANMVFEAERD